MQYNTWKNAIVRVLGDSSRPLNVNEIYDLISNNKYYRKLFRYRDYYINLPTN